MSFVWSIKAASIAGTRHRQNGMECQDAFHWKQPRKGLLMAAVADGAGTARHSAIASRLASQTAVDWLASHQENLPSASDDHAWGPFFEGAIVAAAQAVKNESAQRKIPLSQLSTTLILFVATPEFSAAAQIGDGVVVLNDANANLFSMTIPQHGEYRNDTIFLTSKGALEQSRVSLWNGQPSHFAMMTDGLELLALNVRDASPHPPFFDPLWNFSKNGQEEKDANSQLAAFLSSSRIASRTDDDLTLVLGCLKEENL